MTLSEYQYQTNGHSKFRLLFHISFATKYRKSILNPSIESKFHLIFLQTASNLGAELLDFAIDEDHVHLIVSLTPMMAVSQFMSQLKSKASFAIKKQMQEHSNRKAIWQTGYFCESVSPKACRNLSSYLKHHEADRVAAEVNITYNA